MAHLVSDISNRDRRSTDEDTDEFAGGSIVNNVVQTLHRYFASRNYVTASFNFRYVLGFCIISIFWQNRTVLTKTISTFVRGSGRSGGRTSWTAMPERQDYMAVLEYLHNSKEYPEISSVIMCVSVCNLYILTLYT